MLSRGLLSWGGLVSVIAGALLAVGAVSNAFGGPHGTVPGILVVVVGHALLVFALTALYIVQIGSIDGLGKAGFILAAYGTVLVAAALYGRLPFVGASPDLITEMETNMRSPLVDLVIVPGLLAFPTGVALLGDATERVRFFPRFSGWLLAAGGLASGVGLLFEWQPVVLLGTLALAGALVWLGRCLWAGLYGTRPAPAAVAGD